MSGPPRVAQERNASSGPRGWSALPLLLAAALGCRTPPEAPAPAASSTKPDTGACGEIPPDVQALVNALDENPDMLHADFTPAVHSLIERGLAGACAVVSRLDAPERMSRMHAQRVLEGVVGARHGWQAGRGYPDGYGEEHTRAVLAELGYEFDAAAGVRQAAAKRWRVWLAAQPSVPPPYTPPDGPSREQMVAALAPARGALERCVEAMGPVDVVVVFASTGRVASIWSQYNVGEGGRRCLQQAVANISVPPFKRADASVVYTPASQ